MAIKQGDKIKVNYTGTLDDGTVFDSSEGKAPIEFEVGAKQVIKGFDGAVVGMDKGDEKNIKLAPSEAYGDYNPAMIQKFPKEKLPKEPEPQVGMVLMLGSPDGKQVPAKIAAIDDKEVSIDLNHPLAGKTLNFTLKIVEC